MRVYVPEAEVDFGYDRVFGIADRASFEAKTLSKAIGSTYLHVAGRIVDNSGVIDLLNRWWEEDHADRGPGGRPRFVDDRQALVLVMAHALAGLPLTYLELAQTVEKRLTWKQARKYGLPFDQSASWYDRLYRTMRNILRVFDPYPYPYDDERLRRTGDPLAKIGRRRILTEDELAQLRAWRDPIVQEQRQQRIDEFCHALVSSSVKMADHYTQHWRGNTALDATYVKIRGTKGVRDAPTGSRPRCVDVDAGWYVRDTTDHAAPAGKSRSGKHKREYGYELEVVSMTRNHPDDDPDSLPYPLLMVAVGFHRPGEIRRDPSRMYTALAADGHPPAHVAVDRAYSYLQTQNFAGPVRALGHELVIDYQKTDLGLQTHYKDFILVDGTWYLNVMPKDLVTATRDRIEGRIDDEELEDKLQARTKYQLKRKGRPDADGYQRFLLPDPAGYIPADVITGEVVAYPASKTVTIPAIVDKNGADKHRQLYPYKSAAWEKWYGLRATVEHQNGFLKAGTVSDLANEDLRQARGYAFQYLAATVLVVSSNVRKIRTFLNGLAGPRNPKSPERPLKRAARRTSRSTGPRLRDSLDRRTTRYPSRT